MASSPETVKFAAVLLAAGPSSRLGQPKQLVKYEGESLVRRMARLLVMLEPETVTVVAGSDFDEVQRELSALPVVVVRNEDWERGIGSSIACGARNSPEAIDGLLIAVCDLWKLTELDLERLLSTWLTDISRISAAYWYEDKAIVYGPPSVFPRIMIRELKKLDGKHGAKALIARHLDEAQLVGIENAACDLDTPADLEQLLKRQ